MVYILYLTAAVLAVLKLLGEIAISWWIIAGLAALPLAIFAVLFAIALIGVLILEARA